MLQLYLFDSGYSLVVLEEGEGVVFVLLLLLILYLLILDLLIFALKSVNDI